MHIHVFKIILNVFKKKGWSYIQVISLSHLNNALFLNQISLSLSPLSSTASSEDKKIFSTISLDHIKTIQITETCLLGIFNQFWDQPLIDLYEISNF